MQIICGSYSNFGNRQSISKRWILNLTVNLLKLTWKSSVTLWLVFADVSINEIFQAVACALPSASETFRSSSLSSHLLPTNMTGIFTISWPYNWTHVIWCIFIDIIRVHWLTLSSFIRFHIGLSSSKLCFEHTEYTKMKAWPFVIDNLCIAGNWCDPVVSVICRVQIVLLQLMTCKMIKNETYIRCRHCLLEHYC